MTHDQIEGWIRDIAEHFTTTYGEDPRFEMPSAVYYLYDEEGEFRGLAPVMLPKHLWASVRDHLSHNADRLGIHGFVHVSEAWMKQMDKKETDSLPKGEDGLPMMDISGDPESIEILQLTGGDREGNLVSVVYRINRGGGEVLTEEMVMRNEDGVNLTAKWALWARTSQETKH